MKRLLKVTLFTALLTLARMIAGFIVVKVVALLAGPIGLAMLGQIQSFIASLTGVIKAPVGSGIVRYTAEYQHEGFNACAPWWRASLQWMLAILVLVVPVGVYFSNEVSSWLFKSTDQAWLVVLISSLLPLSGIGTLINSVINGQKQYKRFVFLGMTAVLFSSSIMILLIFYQNIRGALLAASMQSALIGVVMVVGSLKQPWMKFRYWWGETETKHRRAIGKYVLMALTTALTIPISHIFVRDILVTNVGWKETGQWQAVWKISEVYLGVITMALGTYFLPKLSAMKDSRLIQSEVIKTIKFIFPIVLLMAVAIYLLRDVAIFLLFTEEFRSARDLFAVQLLGDVFKILSIICAYPMVSRGASKWYVSTEIVFACLFVLLTFILVPYFSTQGANIAYLVSYILYFLFISINLRRFSQ